MFLGSGTSLPCRIEWGLRTRPVSDSPTCTHNKRLALNTSYVPTVCPPPGPISLHRPPHADAAHIGVDVK